MSFLENPIPPTVALTLLGVVAFSFVSTAVLINPLSVDALTAENHFDINLNVRGWSQSPPVEGGTELIDFDHDIDPDAQGRPRGPQLSTLLENEARPQITSLHRVHHWDESAGQPAEGITLVDPETSVLDDIATLAGFATNAGQTVLVPSARYGIGGGCDVMVLYATPTEITIKYTREDDMVWGYGLHIHNFDVDPEIVRMYNELNEAGRQQLPAMCAGHRLGTATGNEILVAIRDTGSFMDPRWERDWWHDGPAQENSNCQCQLSPTEPEKRDIPADSKDPDDYITIPLILDPSESMGGLDDDVHRLLKNMVVDQGYEVSCGSPELFVNAFAGNADHIRDFFDVNRNLSGPHDFLELRSSGNQKVNLTRARVPIYRGSESSELTHKASSYEGFFGTNIVKNPDGGNMVAQSGVASNLLSSSLKCLVKINNMITARELCSRLQNPELCALHQEINGSINPNTNQEYYLFSTPNQEADGKTSLLSAIEEWQSQSPSIGCNQMMGAYKSNYPMSREEFYSVQKAITHSPLDLDKVYRYAFVLLSPLQNPDSYCDTGERDPFWYLLRDPNSQNEQDCPGSAIGKEHFNRHKRIPVIIAFKVPTIATNRIKSLPLQDSASLTADAIAKSKTKIDHTTSANFDSREEFLREVAAAKEVWDGTNALNEDEANLARMGLTIDCHGLPHCDGAYGASVLKQALVHLVNGSEQPCSGDSFFTSTNPADIIASADNPEPHGLSERANIIGTQAEVSHNEKRAFLEDYHNVDLSSSAAHNWEWWLRVNRSEANTIIDGGEDLVGESVLVHIVSPIGSNLRYIEQRMAFLFETEMLEKMVEANVMVDAEGREGNIARFFPLEDIDFGYDDTSARHSYRHIDCPNETDSDGRVIIDPHTGQPRKTDCAAAEVRMDDENVGLFIEGAKLGWFIRKIQLAITNSTPVNDAYAYLASCQRIEDLFLGRCGDPLETVYGPPDGEPWWGSSVASGSCEVITDDSSPCSYNNLRSSLAEYIQRTNSPPISDQELSKRATQASIICNAESGGDPAAQNLGCETASMVDYSIGLFQINLLAHSCSRFDSQNFQRFACNPNYPCAERSLRYIDSSLNPEGILCCSGYFNFNWGDYNCTINNYTGEASAISREVDRCADYLSNPENNIMAAFTLSGAGSNWWAWATARPNECGICTESGVCGGLPAN